mmetsp:Transcript_31520/g.89486  ORF Transcript_31520/g.89486 Transcript_31520/m.89486 type:complete len:190 (-) Transcript_31520:342-911(-)
MSQSGTMDSPANMETKHEHGFHKWGCQEAWDAASLGGASQGGEGPIASLTMPVINPKGPGSHEGRRTVKGVEGHALRQLVMVLDKEGRYVLVVIRFCQLPGVQRFPISTTAPRNPHLSFPVLPCQLCTSHAMSSLHPPLPKPHPLVHRSSKAQHLSFATRSSSSVPFKVSSSSSVQNIGKYSLLGIDKK